MVPSENFLVDTQSRFNRLQSRPYENARVSGSILLSMPHRTFFVLSNKFRSRVALTPKAVIWNVMQITKIHFVTSTTLGAAQQVRALAGCTQLGGMN
jgi:hypothetical protein